LGSRLALRFVFCLCLLVVWRLSAGLSPSWAHAFSGLASPCLAMPCHAMPAGSYPFYLEPHPTRRRGSTLPDDLTLPYHCTLVRTLPLFSLSHTHTSYHTYLPPLPRIYLASIDSFSFTHPSASALFGSLLARLGRATIFSFPTPAPHRIPLGYSLELISPYYKRFGQILPGHAFIRGPAHCI
jgi:hypothetical protein